MNYKLSKILLLSFIAQLNIGCALYADMSILNVSNEAICVDMGSVKKKKIEINEEKDFFIPPDTAVYINVERSGVNQTYVLSPLPGQYLRNNLFKERYRLIYDKGSKFYAMKKNEKPIEAMKKQPTNYPLIPMSKMNSNESNAKLQFFDVDEVNRRIEKSNKTNSHGQPKASRCSVLPAHDL